MAIVDTFFNMTNVTGGLSARVLQYETPNGNWIISGLLEDMPDRVYITGSVHRIVFHKATQTQTTRLVTKWGSDISAPESLVYSNSKPLPKYVQSAVAIMHKLMRAKRMVYIYNKGDSIPTLSPLTAYLRKYGKTGSTTTNGKVKYRVYLDGMVIGWFKREDKAVERLKVTKAENPGGEIYIEKIVETIIRLY